MRRSTSFTIGILAAILLLSLQVALGKPQQASLSLRQGLLTDKEEKDPLGTGVRAGLLTDNEEEGPLGSGGNAPICCRCVSVDAPCNNDLDKTINKKNQNPKIGLTCKNEIESDVFGCDVGGVIVSDQKNLVDLRSPNRCSLANGQKTCCDPVSNTFKTHLVDLRDNFEDTIFRDTEKICQADDVGATQNFEIGVVCGKRDSRVYFDAGLEPGFTNPGEWPWSVLIYAGQGSQKRYIGSGALMDNDVVATVAHKMKDFVNKPEDLVVHIGDWDPNSVGGPFGSGKEKHLHVEMAVDCVKIHGGADLDNTLENNVAVLKLRPKKQQPIRRTNESKKVISVVTLRALPDRRADDPTGPQPQILTLGERNGLLTDNQAFDPLGTQRAENQETLAPSYINTVCLPESRDQFTTETCWVAAWGSNLERQREVDLPLMSRAECQRVLEPVFRKSGVLNWKLKPSEVCAGGVPGKDTCQGEGGAPLVCYSRSRDQYFAVGLVSYGFGCNGTLPAVYTNLMDSGVQGMIKQAFGNKDYCEPF